MGKEVWEVDLRSRKTGDSVETIFQENMMLLVNL